MESFFLLFQNWQNYYLLTGGAAATLAGLLFIALTFGVSYIKGDAEKAIKTWAEPPLHDFVQVLVISCLAEFPSLRPGLLALILFAYNLLRSRKLWQVYQDLSVHSQQQRRFELQDWLLLSILPAASYVLLYLCSLGLALGWQWVTTGLAIYTLTTLFIGLNKTWSQVVWMALQKHKGGQQ